MTSVLQIGNRTISSAEIIPLLAGYHMLPLLQRELLIDAAIAAIELTAPEQVIAIEQFDAAHQLTQETQRSAWLQRYGMTQKQKDALATRTLSIEKFKIATWRPKLESYFLSYKSQLDSVIYSLLRTLELGVAQELYFRIQAQEQSFAECEREYSTGPEAQRGGIIGPVNLSQPHPTIAKMLSSSQTGQVMPPTQLGESWVIVQLEKFIPAQFDQSMRQQLLNHLFAAWLEQQMQQLSVVARHKSAQELVAV